jgi:hypothetical protein
MRLKRLADCEMKKLSPPKCTPLEIGVRGGIFFGNHAMMPAELSTHQGNTPEGECEHSPLWGCFPFPADVLAAENARHDARHDVRDVAGISQTIARGYSR